MKKHLLLSILFASLVPACAFHGVVRSPISTVSMRPVVLPGAVVGVGTHVAMGVNTSPQGAVMGVATPQGNVRMGVSAGPNGAGIQLATPNGGVSLGAGGSGMGAGISVAGTDARGNAVSASVNVAP
jgi:hypothetical protein